MFFPYACGCCLPACPAADVISAVEFDSEGSYLATGDKGGRVVLFEKVSSQQVRQQGGVLDLFDRRATQTTESY